MVRKSSERQNKIKNMENVESYQHQIQQVKQVRNKEVQGLPVKWETLDLYEFPTIEFYNKSILLPPDMG